MHKKIFVVFVQELYFYL